MVRIVLKDPLPELIRLLLSAGSPPGLPAVQENVSVPGILLHKTVCQLLGFCDLGRQTRRIFGSLLPLLKPRISPFLPGVLCLILPPGLPLQRKKPQPLCVHIRVVYAKSLQLIQLLQKPVLFPPVDLALYVQIIADIGVGVHVLLIRHLKQAVVNKGIVLDIVCGVIQKILGKLLKDVVPVLHDLKLSIHQLPDRPGEINVVHKVQKKSFPGFQGRIQIVAHRIRQRLLPLLCILPCADVPVNPVNLLHPEVDLGLFLLFPLIILRLPGKPQSLLISLPKPLKPLRIILRVGVLKKRSVGVPYSMFIFRLLDPQDTEYHLPFHPIPSLSKYKLSFSPRNSNSLYFIQLTCHLSMLSLA